MWKRISETHRKFHKLFEGELFVRRKKTFQVLSIAGDRWLISRIPYENVDVEGMPDTLRIPLETLDTMKEGGPFDYDPEQGLGLGDYLIPSEKIDISLSLEDMKGVGALDEEDRRFVREVIQVAPDKLDGESTLSRELMFGYDKEGGDVFYTDSIGAVQTECGVNASFAAYKWDMDMALKAPPKENIAFKVGKEYVLSKWTDKGFRVLFNFPQSRSKLPPVRERIQESKPNTLYKIDARALIVQIEKIKQSIRKGKKAQGYIVLASGKAYVGGLKGGKPINLQVSTVGDHDNEWAPLDMAYLFRHLPIALEGASKCWIGFPSSIESPVYIETAYRKAIVSGYIPYDETEKAVKDLQNPKNED